MSSTAAAPAGIRAGTNRLALVFAGLMMVLLLAALDSTIVATALPTIVGDLGGLERIAWVTSAFLLAQTAVTPLYGKLGDQLGRKRVLQSAIVLFLAGSALCGLSESMTELIAFRAVQGLGAGGLIVLVQASVGDIVPPRERGRYQGLFGAVFGFAAVAGPLLGGVLVDNLSWRWIFYVNLPIGLLALAVISATLPQAQRTRRPAIDYLGAGVLASALSALVLVASLGGTTWPWGSAQVVLVALAGVALLVAFAFVERHAREPVLPLSLLHDEVFRVSTLLSLIVGFALFGTITFLPLFFQTVFHSSPTSAGLRLIPLMGGLVTASIISGRRIAATGRYRRFPIAGTLLMTAGMLLLSRIGLGTSSLAIDGSLVVLGLGLGLTMQVLVLAVQNAVDYEMLGAATSGVTLARGIGGSFGAAVFGTIFTTRLRSQLSGVLHGPLAAQVAGGGRLTGTQVASLPGPARVAYESAYVNALHPVFITAGVIAAVGFVLSLRLRERPLRSTAATSTGLDDSLAAPKSPSSLAEIDRALSIAAGEQRRREFGARMVARAGLDISPGAAWALARFSSYGVAGTLEMARSVGIPEERIAPVQRELRERGLVEGEGAGARLTPAGTAMADQLLSARREELCTLLAGQEDAERTPEVQGLIERLCVELSGERPDRAGDGAQPAAGAQASIS
jgi:EmrB/QacA subfamily drug resistance transporter